MEHKISNYFVIFFFSMYRSILYGTAYKCIITISEKPVLRKQKTR